LADLQRTVYPHSGHPSSEGRAQDSVSGGIAQAMQTLGTLVLYWWPRWWWAVCRCIHLQTQNFYNPQTDVDNIS